MATCIINKVTTNSYIMMHLQALTQMHNKFKMIFELYCFAGALLVNNSCIFMRIDLILILECSSLTLKYLKILFVFVNNTFTDEQKPYQTIPKTLNNLSSSNQPKPKQGERTHTSLLPHQEYEMTNSSLLRHQN